jgi:hypothetical protein
MERIIELIIDEENEFSGIEAISVVENPAIEEDFIALKEHKEVKLAEVDKEKRILMGAALIPNKKIFRKGEEDDYYIFFSEETVRKASELFLMKGNQNNSTLEHDIELKGMSVVESWIIEDEKKDKSRKYDFDLPVGTWMVSVKVNNDDVWNQVKLGEVKGFSIEGYFADKMDGPKESLPENLCEECLEELNAEFDLLEIVESLSEEVALESYGGYPESASNNAELGIKRNKALNNKCATQVGKVRARQLQRKEKFTKSTLKRIYSYLSRAAEYYDPKKPDSCGTISYLLWGGKSMLNWTESKLKGLEAAKVGPKGGITKSPKAPKSGTPNKNPKGKGTAKGNAKGKTGAKVSAKDRATLQKKADDFNKRYKEKLGYGVTVGMLSSVFQRGLGAFNTSHSPNVKSASQWAFARTNAFLYLVKNGRPQNAKYTTDYDLLPKKHPKSSKK